MAGLGDLHLYVNEWPLEAVAAWGDLEVIHGRNGPREMTWEMALGPRERPHPLIRNAAVELYDGPLLIWAGSLSQPDWNSLRFVAIGIAELGDGAECLSGGAVTSKPNPAIDSAISREVVPWIRGYDFGDDPIAGDDGAAGVDDPEPGKLGELLDKWELEDEDGGKWHVAPSGLVTKRVEDVTKPLWFVRPGVAQVGAADDDVTDRVFLRYFSSTAGRSRTASYPAATPRGGVERRASITHLGPMTSTRATNIAKGMYRKAQEGRIGFTNGIEVTSRQLSDRGNHDANLAQVLAGDPVQVQDTQDPRGSSAGLDFAFVLDETRWRPADDVIQLNPVGLVSRSWEQVVIDANARGDN